MIEKYGPQLDGFSATLLLQTRSISSKEKEKQGVGSSMDTLFDIDLGWETDDLDGGVGYE